MVIIVACALNMDEYQVVENLICETLRWLAGNMSHRHIGVDTVAIDQLLYVFIEGVLFKVGRDTREAIDMEEMKWRYMGEEYNPKNKWWQPMWAPQKDGDLVLTKK